MRGVLLARYAPVPMSAMKARKLHTLCTATWCCCGHPRSADLTAALDAPPSGGAHRVFGYGSAGPYGPGYDLARFLRDAQDRLSGPHVYPARWYKEARGG